MKLAETLRECAGLERRIAGFYDQFAEMWRDDPELGPFWRTMAAEERGHAAALDGLADSLHPSDGRRRGFERGAVAQLRGYVLGAGRLVGSVSLDDAFQAAIDLESLELDRVYHCLLAALDLEDTPSRDALRRCLERLGPHRESLPDVIERRATADHLRERATLLLRYRPPAR